MTTSSIKQLLDQNLEELNTTQGTRAFKVCREVTDCTVKLWNENMIEPVQQCVNSMANTYSNTNDEVLKLAIENVFIYSLGDKMLNSCNKGQCKEVLPGVFYDMLIRQVLAAGY